MGNSKFKLSDMIPNAWFHKLKHMTKRNDKTKTKNNNNNKNYYINQHHQNLQNAAKKKLVVSLSPPTNSKNDISEEPPRRSSKRRSTSSFRRRNNYNNINNSKPVFKPTNNSSDNTSSSEFASLFADDEESDYFYDNDTSFLRLSSSTADIIIDLESNEKSFNIRTGQLSDEIVDLPPIITRPNRINFDDTVKNCRSRKNSNIRSFSSSSSNSFELEKSKTLEINRKTRTASKIQAGRRSSSSSSSSIIGGIRLRSNSPRLACARKSLSVSDRKRTSALSESFAVVKSSVDPERDFRESMVEMIVQNQIRASKDLEELLACFLSLNSKQYHDVIVKAFEQIWFDMPSIPLQ